MQAQAIASDPVLRAQFSPQWQVVSNSPQAILEAVSKASAQCWLWLDIQGDIDTPTTELLLAMGLQQGSVDYLKRERLPPKIEFFGEQTLVVYRGIRDEDPDLDYQHVPVGLLFTDRLLVTIHRVRSRGVDAGWQRIAASELCGSPRAMALEIIGFAATVYQQDLLEFEQTLTGLEEEILYQPQDETLRALTLYRARLRRLRRVFAYHLRLLDDWQRAQEGSYTERERALRREAHDRWERLLSLVTMFYELCGDLMDGYISLSSHQLNRKIQVLTVVSAIFVPLTFVAGIYGMNFEYMPELTVRWAYPALLALMGTGAALGLWLLRRKQWL